MLRFDTMYSALGLRGRSVLASELGARHDEDGMLLVDDHQRTSVPGLYAVGDVVKGLTQIGVAMGHAAIAASAINSSLQRRPRPRPSAGGSLPALPSHNAACRAVSSERSRALHVP